jgi:hypothetical protein
VTAQNSQNRAANARKPASAGRLPKDPDHSLAEIYGTIIYSPAVRFCVSVRELNDALHWLTIEGVPGKIEVQAWLSTFGLPQPEMEKCSAQWESRSKQIFSN